MSETVFPRQVLDRLIQFDGRPEQFWQKLAELAKPLLGASQAAVLVRSAGQAQAEWRLLAQTLVAGSARTVEQWLDQGLPTRLAQGVVIERRGGMLRGFARLVTDEAHRDVVLIVEGSAQSARDDAALAYPARARDRPFRHGPAAQDRPRPAVRLAQAGTAGAGGATGPRAS